MADSDYYYDENLQEWVLRPAGTEVASPETNIAFSAQVDSVKEEPQRDEPPQSTSNAAPQEGSSEEPPERKLLCEGLDMIIYSINNGYNLQLDNYDKATCIVTLDLSQCSNLKIIPEGNVKLEDDTKIIVEVPPMTQVKCVDLPVDNWDLCSCEMKYKALIRKQQGKA